MGGGRGWHTKSYKDGPRPKALSEVRYPNFSSCPSIENTVSRDKKMHPPFMHTALVLVVINTSHRLPISIYLFSIILERQ